MWRSTPKDYVFSIQTDDTFGDCVTTFGECNVVFNLPDRVFRFFLFPGRLGPPVPAHFSG